MAATSPAVSLKPEPSAARIRPQSNTRRVIRAFMRNRFALLGLIIIVLLILGAIFADIIAPWPPNEPHYTSRLKPPSAEFPLGTDELGRDLLSRLLYGARISLAIGFVAQAVSISIGMFMGAVSGWLGGWADDLIMRLADVFFAIPGLMFLVVWVTIFEANPLSIFLGLGLISWPGTARLMRGQVLSLKNLDYVIAARSIGATGRRILITHILPNAIAPMIVVATLGIAGAILSEAFLSFLGLGIQIPTPSWGTMVDAGRNYMLTAWWYAIYPGLTIMLTVLGFNFLGDGLRDALEPRAASG
jgi:peptide/nickel transport system permease protein